MAWDFKFDPVTRDLIDNGRGSVETTENADTLVMHQLLIHFRKWWGAPQIGSDLYDLKKFAREPETLAPLEVRRALDLLVKRGRISNVQSTARSQVNSGRVIVDTTFRDTATGQLVSAFIKAGS